MFRIIPHWIKTGKAGKFREFTVSELPRCTRMLSYQQMLWPGQDDLFGTFVFEAVDLSRAVHEHLESNAIDGRVTVPDLELFEWFQGRDRTCDATTILPSAWQGVEIIILNGVIRTARFEVLCHGCQKLYKPDEVASPPPSERVGTIYHRLACPTGHLLSRIEVMHIC